MSSSDQPYYMANTGLADEPAPANAFNNGASSTAASPTSAAPVVIAGDYLPPTESSVEASPKMENSFSSAPYGDVADDNITKGVTQPKRCNDFFFALLFYAHLGVMGWAASRYGSAMLDDVVDAYGDYMDFLKGYNDGNDGRRMTSILVDSAFDYVTGNRRLQNGDDDGAGNGNLNSNVGIQDIVLLLGVSTIFCSIVSTLALFLLMHFSHGLIVISLFFNILVAGLMTAAAFMAGSPFGAIMFLLLTIFTIYYTWVVWARIPFAAANLETAVTAVQKNGGLTVIAYGSLLLLFGWSIWWSVAFVASMYVSGECNAEGMCQNEPNGWIIFAFALSYYWTHQVIKNTVHVTVAGAVGTWWFAPLEAASCCSKAVRDSFLRSITLSFGSICLGSLIVAIVQATRDLLKNLREQGDSVLLCCAECLLSCLETLIEYFNKWAFVFVGLYGYSFIDAGRNVITLFKGRGWTTIITDNLVDSVLFLVSIGVGLITGAIASLVAHSTGMVFGNDAGSLAVPFITGLVIGFVLTSIMMSVVSSAVNTVIVCYAEAPNEFQTNHPELSNEMRTSWRQAWPTDFKY